MERQIIDGQFEVTGTIEGLAQGLEGIAEEVKKMIHEICYLKSEIRRLRQSFEELAKYEKLSV